jgi:serine/threonine protein kinase
MSLIAGVRLGPYEIQSAIGAGGMGEVYKARDTRLDRTVAIKVLPARVASDPNLRERFEREARAVAGLNHPHICTLHDVGRQDGVDFLVMEYLEGQTLADRLANGALPLDKVLQYAIQIADALDKAHRAGITHRDLKPANIFLTKSGAKLLDFGLAKLKQGASPAAALSGFQTGDDTMTAEGTLLGTLQYMSPEQVEGKEADARSDIFAFGAVVYEMATGKRAFEGKSQAGVMAKILEQDPPPMSTVQAMTPPALDRVLRTCLEKDPDERWQTAHDVRKQLTWIAEGGVEVTPLTTASTKGSGALRRRAVRWIPGVMVLVAVSGLAIWSLSTRRSAPQSVSRFTITLPPHERLPVLQSATGGTRSWLAISHDGRHLAYVATRGSIYQLYLRAIDSLEARPISGTEGAVDPFFSPDGQWIGFFADGKVKKVSVNGGAALTLADAPNAQGASWGSQGTIVFGTAASVLFQVPDEGGNPRPLTQMAKGETSHRDPQFLPSGKAVLFTAGGLPSGAAEKVAVQLIETGERRNLLQRGTSPGYASSGHLLYSQGRTLMAVPFDPQRLAIVGTSVPVVEGILEYANIGAAAQYSISATGSLVYIPAGLDGIQRRLVWVGRDGAQQLLAAPPRAYDWPQLSPDGRRIAVEIAE